MSRDRLAPCAEWVSLVEKPLAVVLVAAGATIATAVVLGSYAGWPRLLRLAHARHSWAWLAVCLFGELVAYLGYVLTIRDMARVDGEWEAAHCHRAFRRLSAQAP